MECKLLPCTHNKVTYLVDCFLACKCASICQSCRRRGNCLRDGVATCSAAQAANATGVVISAEPGSDVEQMDCNGRECDLPLQIWATMLPYHEALHIRQVQQAASSMRLWVLLPKSSVDTGKLHLNTHTGIAVTALRSWQQRKK